MGTRSGGLGQHSAPMRRRILGGLGWLGPGRPHRRGAPDRPRGLSERDAALARNSERGPNIVQQGEPFLMGSRCLPRIGHLADVCRCLKGHTLLTSLTR